MSVRIVKRARSANRADHNAGFTLLEAIVAIAVIGLALIPLVSFLSLSANELAKAAEANERSFVTQSAIAMMDSINPTEDPTGSLPLNSSVMVDWTSEELIPAGKQIMPSTGLPAFQIAFYKVHVAVSRKASGPWFDFDMRKVGYHSVSAFETPPSGTK